MAVWRGSSLVATALLVRAKAVNCVEQHQVPRKHLASAVKTSVKGKPWSQWEKRAAAATDLDRRNEVRHQPNFLKR